MAEANHPPVVSVIVPTRNRCDQIPSALQSIGSQTLSNFECLVIDDNSQSIHKERYKEIIENMGGRFKYVVTEDMSLNHLGPSRARNIGIGIARGDYIAFCDDDDMWTRDDHLEVAVSALKDNMADIFFADMRTVAKGLVENPSFYRSFISKHRKNQIHSSGSLHSLEKKELSLMLRHRTIHCNTIVLSKDLLSRAGEYWEKIDFAEDHDFCFRVFDAASGIVYRNVPVSDLNVSPHQSIARSYADIDRSLFGIIACLHAETIIRNKYLRKTLRQNQAWRLIELSRFLREKNNYSAGCQFSLRSLATSPSFSGLREFFIAGTAAIASFAAGRVSMRRARSASITE